MHIFYSSNLQTPIITLPKDESMHAFSVLRLKNDTQVMVTDGKGSMCYGKIVNITKNDTSINITSRIENYNKPSFSTHIAIAPTKNINRYEWFLEKATEIGVSNITPILTHRSERKTVKYDRSHKVIVSAMKQSQKAYLPELEELILLKDFLNTLSDDTTKFIAHCNDNYQKVELKQLVEPNKRSVILIGAEGDFTSYEIEMALSYGFQSVALGSSRLRTETAALYATTLIAIANI